MRYLRHKHNRKTLNLYKILFGVVPPYKILCDGNFISQAMKMQVDCNDTLPKLLEDTTYLHVTECILHEIRSLGSKADALEAVASRFPVIRCSGKHNHKTPKGAAECIKDILMTTPAHGHFFVATQDADLRSELRAIPGIPLILYSQNVLVLEPPSKASKTAVVTKEAASALLSPEERAAIKRAKKEARELAAAETEDKSKPSASTAAVSGVKRKRHGPSGPNPLAVKKKSAKPAAAGAGARDAGSAADESDAPTVSKKTRRAGNRHKRKELTDGDRAYAAEGAGSDSDSDA